MIKIIDYKAGNAPSVMHAVSRLGHEAGFARAAGDIVGATHIILPGVGSAAATMESLRELGLVDALGDAVLRRKTLFLGVCVGLQILFEHSEEGDTDCLGWLKGRVVRFDSTKVRVPQMGWNSVSFSDGTREDCFYFVNSFHAVPNDDTDVWGTAFYGSRFTAAVHRENIYATQFHIEKSGEAGLALLDGFLRMGGVEYRGGTTMQDHA
jgi:glutamine amidotransferase